LAIPALAGLLVYSAVIKRIVASRCYSHDVLDLETFQIPVIEMTSRIIQGVTCFGEMC